MTVSGQIPSPAPARIKRRRFASVRTISALILREMATTYGRSPGGYIWAVLEPLGGIILMSVAFSLFLRGPQLGVNFSMFYATGFVPFTMYNVISGKIAQSLLFSKPLMAYPTVTYIDAILARFWLNMLTELMVAYIIFVGLIALFDTRVAPDLLTIARAMVLTSALGLGIGTLNCFLYTRFPVWQRAWSILMRPLFLMSCIFYLFDAIPQPFRGYLWYNPLVHVVGLMRRGFYPTYDAPYVSEAYVYGVSALCFVIGLILLRRYQYDLLSL